MLGKVFSRFRHCPHPHPVLCVLVNHAGEYMNCVRIGQELLEAYCENQYDEIHVSRFFKLKVRSIRFFQVKNSANQVISLSDCRSLKFFRLWIQPIRWFHHWAVVQSGFSGWEFSQSGDFAIWPLANQVLSGWESSQSGAFGLPLSSNQVFGLRVQAIR